MDTQTLDTIARTVGQSMTRRTALRGLFAAGVATVAGGSLLLGDDASAKRRKKGKKGRKGQTETPQGGGQPGGGQGLPPGSRCQSSSQCTATYICEVPVNGSNSDEYCSGGQGAVCGAPNGDGDDTYPYCAVGFDCTASGSGYTCQAVPDDH